MDLSRPESIQNPYIINDERYFVGTTREDAVERFDSYEWEEEAEKRADSLWAQGGETFKVFKIRLEINVTSAQETYTAEDD